LVVLGELNVDLAEGGADSGQKNSKSNQEIFHRVLVFFGFMIDFISCQRNI